VNAIFMRLLRLLSLYTGSGDSVLASSLNRIDSYFNDSKNLGRYFFVLDLNYSILSSTMCSFAPSKA